MSQRKNGLVTVFGYGPTGEATVERLLARGQRVRVVQRRRPANLPPAADFQVCDVLNADDVRAAMTGAEQAVITTGFEYSGKVWKQAWPKAMANFIAAAEATGARIVQIDNLYMYGPQRRPLTEETPLTTYGVKPAVRAQVTRMWMTAAAAGRIKWASLRAPDFYGPGVERSHLGDVAFGRIGQGKAAMLVMPPDTPHAVAYVPDIGRAAVTLLDAPDDSYGQAWHVPCAPTTTPRRILEIGARALGQKLNVTAIPLWLPPVLGAFVPFMKEVAEMRFTWNRPYHVDSSKFAARFWSDATPFETGARLTALSFRQAAQPDANAAPVHAPA
ncbi:MAG: NAD-dependent epimerase/dehydratase family protein [Alphaproteobacteria bacterium]|nr:NAD-dependent epimerase/dehydratase family protein [Alphaproteobacteria bacterium]